MSTPSKVTSPRRTRKTKSSSQPKTTPINITAPIREAYRKQQILQAASHFLDTATEEEKKISYQIKNIFSFKIPQDFRNEISRLLGESLAKCKVIPLPIAKTRQSKSAMEV